MSIGARGSVSAVAGFIGEATVTETPWAEFVESASASMRPVEAIIREIARSEVAVLLLGEKGAGKQATARRIHELSRKRSYPFRSLMCRSLQPKDLTDSDGLLGSGTVYLEEIAELSAECQTRLLQALGEYGNSEGARLICGSAHNLDVEVRAGSLREDLYYRISGICLRLPPLRQRREDIPRLLEHFLGKYAHDLQRPKPALDGERWRRLHEYAWPGNVRELEDAAKVLVALGDAPEVLGGLRAFERKAEIGQGSNGVSLKAASKAASREAEKGLILDTLARTRWNRRRAAKELQISYKALLYKLKQIRCEGIS